MQFIKLLRWMRGYVSFTVQADSVERFISLCVHKGVYSWGNRCTEGKFFGYTTVSNYHKMHRLLRKAKGTSRITGRYGLPFLLQRYHKRVGILVGAAVFLSFLLVMQQFIWVIRVEGCERLDPVILQNALKTMGVHKGAWRRGIDPTRVKNELVILVDDLAWATLNLRGVTATLLVRERTPIPEKIDIDQPSNVVAAQDGQIKTLIVLDGKPVLREGDTVRAGEIIVSGVNEDRWGLTHLVRANARVIAHVPETRTVAIPLVQEEICPTGEEVHRNYLNLFGMRIPLFLYRELDGEYNLERSLNKPTLFGMPLPFALEQERYLFFTREHRQIDQQTALLMAQQALLEQEQTQIEGKIISCERTARTEGDQLILTVEYVIERDIAKLVEIPILDQFGEKPPLKKREGGY